jgi:2-iminobutanoate/2-iminopropanoate deaminase
MGPEDIVRINVYSTEADGLKYVRAHREKYLAPGHTPASTWVVVSQLANPKWVVEMETIAAKA